MTLLKYLKLKVDLPVAICLASVAAFTIGPVAAKWLGPVIAKSLW